MESERTNGNRADSDPMDGDQKREIYRRTQREVESVLTGIDDAITAMASCAALLHANLPYASWTGFYRVVAPRQLRIGPYQGPLGCLEISFDQGVCGAAAREEKPQVVPDVNAFPGHIACDSAARSEIVVPVYAPGGELVAVLDIDSHSPAAFDEIDREGLVAIVERLAASLADNARAWSVEESIRRG
jgi:L-methionine (R)-S-oxide reductase